MTLNFTCKIKVIPLSQAVYVLQGSKDFDATWVQVQMNIEC
jgi:hypothetical protein